MSTPLKFKKWEGKQVPEAEQQTRQRKRHELFTKEFWLVSRKNPSMRRAERRLLARKQSKIRFSSLGQEASF